MAKGNRNRNNRKANRKQQIKEFRKVSVDFIGESLDKESVAWSYLELVSHDELKEHLSYDGNRIEFSSLVTDIDAKDDADGYAYIFQFVNSILEDVARNTGVEFVAIFDNELRAEMVWHTRTGAFIKKIQPGLSTDSIELEFDKIRSARSMLVA